MIYYFYCKKRTSDINLAPKITKNKKILYSINMFNMQKIKITICINIKKTW